MRTSGKGRPLIFNCFSCPHPFMVLHADVWSRAPCRARLPSPCTRPERPRPHMSLPCGQQRAMPPASCAMLPKTGLLCLNRGRTGLDHMSANNVPSPIAIYPTNPYIRSSQHHSLLFHCERTASRTVRASWAARVRLLARIHSRPIR